MGNDRETVMIAKCSSCKYYEMIDNIQGKCHRHAPRPTIVKGGEKDTYIVVLPVMKIEDWCGEFQMAQMPDIETVKDRGVRA